jgi:hypothetical protein
VLCSLLAASGSVLVFKLLPSIKIWYAFGVLSKKEVAAMNLFLSNEDASMLPTKPSSHLLSSCSPIWLA